MGATACGPLARRLGSDYGKDEWGYDAQSPTRSSPWPAFLYERWWRVHVEGAHKVPAHGRAL